MTTRRPTQGERLAIIEQILKTAFEEGGTVWEMKNDIKAIRVDTDKNRDDFKAFRNRGMGILLGVSIAFSAIGAFFHAKVETILRLLWS